MSQPADIPPIISLLDAIGRLRPDSTRSTLRQLLADERVTVNGALVKIARYPIAPDDRIEILPRRQRGSLSLPLPVLHEDADLLVVDKPAGLLTSTVPTEKRPTALAMIRQWAEQVKPRARVGLVHRLDRDASGLLAFAMSQRGLASLKKQFAEHTASRVYAAIISGSIEPPAGTIRTRLVEHVDGTVHRTTRSDKGESAVTHYQTVRQGDGLSLLRVTLETGRKHQIRAHLAARGHPVLGDRLYSGAPASRLMLAAIELSLDHPATGERLSFRIDLPGPLAQRMG